MTEPLDTKAVTMEEFLRACAESNLAIMHKWIEQGGSIHGYEKMPSGTEWRFPIHLACNDYTPHENVIKFLIRHGADVNQKDAFREITPLMVIMNRAANWKIIAPILVGAGADVNMRDGVGETALDKMAYFQQFDRVQWLINHGANVEGGGKKIDTPLFTLIDKSRNKNDKVFSPTEFKLKMNTIILLIDKSMEKLNLDEAIELRLEITKRIKLLKIEYPEDIEIELEKSIMGKTLLSSKNSLDISDTKINKI